MQGTRIVGMPMREAAKCDFSDLMDCRRLTSILITIMARAVPICISGRSIPTVFRHAVAQFFRCHSSSQGDTRWYRIY